MRCRTFRKKLVAYLDGEVTESRAHRMAQHAEACAACERELEAALEESRVLNASLTGAEAPPELAAGVMRAIEEADLTPAPVEAPRRPPLRWPYAVSLAGAAALLLLAVLPGALNTREPAQEPSTPPASGIVFASGSSDAMRAVEPAPRARAVDERRGDARPSRPSSRAIFVGYDGKPIQQVEPSFFVDEMGSPGAAQSEELSTRNKALGRPSVLSDQERGMMNYALSPVDEAPGSRGGIPGLEAYQQVPTGASALNTLPEGSPGVTVESTDARVKLFVDYREEQGEYQTIYTVNFTADYVIRAPDVNRDGVRIAVTFPFPSGCTTVSGSKLLVDGEEDDEHTSYSIAGMRWVCWFEPKQMKSITISYSARGLGTYRYVLDKNRLTKRFLMLMRIEGLEPGHAVEIPGNALQATAPDAKYAKDWQYAWEHDRLLTTKDIVIDFPKKESPSATASRVMQTVGRHLYVAKYAPLFLALFLVALVMSGVWNRAEAFRIEELAFLGIAFLLFYPLFLFGGAYVGRDFAVWGALAIVVAMSVGYVLASHGRRLIGRVALLEVVLLGAFTYALFDKALTGLLFTGGAVALVTYFMFAHCRRARPLTPSPQPGEGGE